MPARLRAKAAEDTEHYPHSRQEIREFRRNSIIKPRLARDDLYTAIPADKAAAANFVEKDCYRWIFENEPEREEYRRTAAGLGGRASPRALIVWEKSKKVWARGCARFRHLGLLRQCFLAAAGVPCTTVKFR